ncbi:paxillin isoform X2 [Teleopsis dalmanni]|uniref:paxillin isoform X2 n=1 Tax=Teleopsis dalmanni TaxID=139649 RepID=UPI0018CE636B|nr:paxillin isoform X2 [Teleopsis dalmanni]
MSSKLYSKSLHSTRNDYFTVGEFERRLDALLADLQNSVPGHHSQPQYSTASTSTVQQQHNNYGDSSGYGSLRGKVTNQTPVYQEHYTVTETRTSPIGNSSYNSGPAITPGSQSYQYQNQGSLPRHGYNSVTNAAAQTHNNSSLSELDSLLEDLSNARYNNSFDKKETTVPVTYSTPSSKYNTFNSYASVEERPTVDSLLNEMDNASIYAVPNGSLTKSPTPGRHVTITVRETKTEKLTGPDGPVGSIEEKIVQHKDSFTPNHAHAPPMYASSATKELDDLMASLSDFKVNNGSNHHHQQTVTDYAKPNKGVSHLTQTITETTTSTIVEDNEPDQLDSMLGNLQANMSRQGVNTVQKGCCNACEKPIVGQVITALGKTWHPEHFTCNHCNQELGTRNFYERDGFPYCEPDYHNLFSPRCAYCNGAILDKCVTALDKTWHTEHFFCAQCGQQFGEDGFHERDGKPYCRNDYFEMFAPKCNGCNRAIMENYISALNSQWHPDCFVCRDCRQPFQGGSFFDHEGLPYCETHYHAKRGSLCAGCSKPITGRCITAMFKKFHPEHFVCAFCLKQLNKGTFKEQNDKPYCHACFEKIFG